MPIHELQSRLRVVGEIRTGDMTSTATGKTRPRAIDQFRMTSPDRVALEAAALRYGGEIRPWGNGEFELYTERKEIDVVIPPVEAMAFGQDYMLWAKTGSGRSVRQRLCDGRMCDVNKADRVPCLCEAAGGERKCKMNTRLSLLLPELPSLGLWRVYTGSRIAGSELKGLYDLLFIRRHQEPIPAVLRISPRQSTAFDKEGKAEFRNYVVLEIVPKISLTELLMLPSGEGVITAPALAAPVEPVQAQLPQSSKTVVAAVPATVAPMAVADRPFTHWKCFGKPECQTDELDFLKRCNGAGFRPPTGPTDAGYLALLRRTLKQDAIASMAELTAKDWVAMAWAMTKISLGEWTCPDEYVNLVEGTSHGVS